MQAVAISTCRFFGDASAVFSFPAQPIPAKDFYRLRFPVRLMAMPAHCLYFGAPIKNVGAGHHGFIVHMCCRFAVAVGACDVL
jgi:hypothetical protein